MKKFEIDGEILTDLVDICKALISCNIIAITKTGNEKLFSVFDNEIERAKLFIEIYERYTKGEQKQ